MDKIETVEDFLKEYNKYRIDLLNSFHSSASNKGADFISKNLDKLVDSVLTDYIGDTDIQVEDYMKSVAEFVVLSVMLSFYGLSNIDISRLSSKKFGFESCHEVAINTSIILSGVGVASNEVNSKIEAGLLSVIRKDVDFQTYLEDKLFCDDLVNVKELLDGNESVLGVSSEELKKALVLAFNSKIDSSLRVITERFDYIMEGNFGVDSYVGVYTGKPNAVIQGIKYNKASIKAPDNIFTQIYNPVLRALLNINFCYELDSTCTGRQFDLQMICNNYKSDKPIYFPFKMLELVTKSGVYNKKSDSYKFTKKTQMLDYNKIPANRIGSMSNYKKMLYEFFEDNLFSYIYTCVVAYCTGKLKDIEEFRDVKSKDVVEAKILELFNLKPANIYDALYETILKQIDYYVSCVTTVVVMDKLVLGKKEKLGVAYEDILSFRFKVCSKLTYSTYTNREFIHSIVASANLDRGDMADISDNVAKIDERGFSMIDLEYTFDKEKVEALPVFAYKALDALIAQSSGGDSLPISWENILLGRKLNDRIMTSHRGSSVSLQDNQVHWIFSGSRSGKGVMCYNIFATAIASRIPIFYLDRKPDTATVLSKMCPDMFCINGGQYDSLIDSEGVFNPDSYNFKYPAYLDNCLDEKTKFDFVYFRSIMLVLAMFDYADTYKGKNALADKLSSAFSGGVLLVLDEFSNFVANFLADTKPMSVSSGSWLSKAYSQYGLVKDFSVICSDKAKARKALARVEGKKDSTEEDIALAQKEVNVAEARNFSLDKLYFLALSNSYQSVLESIKSKKDAAGNVAKAMHIFLIGQDFSNIKSALDIGSGWFNVGAERNTLRFKSSTGVNPLVAMLSNLSSDMIVGYQKDRPAYLAQGSKEFRTHDLLNATRRCFAYKGTNLTATSLDKLVNTVNHYRGKNNEISSYLDSWSYFKPFLILNNAEEPPIEVRYPTGALKNDNLRLSVRKGIGVVTDSNGNVTDSVNIDANVLSACVNSQYVGQCLSSLESAGLGWDDLLSDNAIEGADGQPHLNPAIGFEGYINKLAGEVPTDAMSLSGQLTNEFIRTVYGYGGTWRDFVCDFNPEYMISTVGFNADGTKNEVIDRFKDSFFSPEFLAMEPAEELGVNLGTLLPFYQMLSGVSDENSDNSPSRVSDIFASSEEPDSYSEDADVESYEEDTDETYSDTSTGAGSSENVHHVDVDIADEFMNTSEEDEDDSWTDEERHRVAVFLTDFYLQCIEAAEPRKANAFKIPQVKTSIVKLFIEMLKKYGY